MVSAHRHGVSFQIVGRNPNVWQARCGRHAEWTGPDYAAVEDKWREHVWQETDTAPTATPQEGANRWEVPA